MNFGRFLATIVALGMGVAAHGQLGVYGTYTAERLSGLTCFATAPATCSSANGIVKPSGVQAGVYYDFKSFGPIRLGGDVRGGVLRSNKSASSAAGGSNITTASTFLGGVRAVVRTPFNFLKPYGEAAAGWTRSDVSEPTHVYDNYVQYEVLAGVDVHVLPILDLRAVEVGLGNMNRFGTGQGQASVGVRSISAGVVLHLP